jgi:hypothetical protein
MHPFVVFSVLDLPADILPAFCCEAVDPNDQF